MPKNVMKLLKRTNNNARNDFDLSHRHVFTANFGELLPVTCIETVPGDTIKLHVSDLLRAIPMVTSPFLRAKQHFDVWYCPYEYLWSGFDEFMTKRSQPTSAAARGTQFLPHINTYELKEDIFGRAEDNLINTDVVGLEYTRGSRKLYDLLGYGRDHTSGSADVSPSVNLFRIAMYNKLFYEEYRQQYYDDGTRGLELSDFSTGYMNPSVLFNFDDLPCTTAYTATPIASSTLLGVKGRTHRLRAMFQMRYRLWKKDLFTGLLPSTQFGDVSMVMSSSAGTDLTALGSYGFGLTEVNSGNNVLIENVNTGKIGLSDDVYGGPASAFIPASFEMFDAGNYKVKPVVTGYETGDGGNTDDPIFMTSGSVSVLDLRKSQAVQIWRENALRAGNRVSDNMKSHYGDSAEHNDNRCTFLGSVDSPLNISDVNATAQTGTGVNQGLGDVAGKGISSINERVFEFKAHKFGCIMVMMSLLPEAEYESYGIDRMNQLIEPEDFFVPEYQNLGLEAVSAQDFYANEISQSRIIGYAPRYVGYKQKLDKVFGAFRGGDGMFRSWVTPKKDVTQVFANANNSPMPLSTLYVNPSLFDQNFAVAWSVSDQFLCDVYFDCDAVRPMSLSGLPNS